MLLVFNSKNKKIKEKMYRKPHITYISNMKALRDYTLRSEKKNALLLIQMNK